MCLDWFVDFGFADLVRLRGVWLSYRFCAEIVGVVGLRRFCFVVGFCFVFVVCSVALATLGCVALLGLVLWLLDFGDCCFWHFVLFLVCFCGVGGKLWVCVLLRGWYNILFSVLDACLLCFGY